MVAYVEVCSPRVGLRAGWAVGMAGVFALFAGEVFEAG